MNLPARTAGASLDALAAEIRREVEAAEADFRSAVQHAIRAGELLIEAKASVKHGEWLPWLQANFSGSIRTAQSYMRLTEHAEDAQRVAHLGIKGALRELAAPTPEKPADKLADPFAELEALLADGEPREEDFTGEFARFRWLEAYIDRSLEVRRAKCRGFIALAADPNVPRRLADALRQTGTLGLVVADLEDTEMTLGGLPGDVVDSANIAYEEARDELERLLGEALTAAEEGGV